jgi:hypothetical protein
MIFSENRADFSDHALNPLARHLAQRHATFQVANGRLNLCWDNSGTAPTDLERKRHPWHIRPALQSEMTFLRIVDLALGLFVEHDLFRKPVSTFRDHASVSDPQE